MTVLGSISRGFKLLLFMLSFASLCIVHPVQKPLEVKPGVISDKDVGNLSLILYIGFLVFLILFILAVTICDRCCEETPPNLERTASEAVLDNYQSRENGTAPPFEAGASPPPYDNFSPPAYDSVL